MKRRLIIVGIAGALALVLGLIGNGIFPAGASGTAFQVMDDPLQIYADAVNAMPTDDVSLSVSKVQQTVTSGAVFTEKAQQAIVYENYDSVQYVSRLDETLSMGDHTVISSEIYADGIAYISVDGSKFLGQMGSAEYRSRLVPAVLLDANLYQQVYGFDNGNSYLIIFRQPTAVESWAQQSDSQFQDAAGAVRVSHEGTILESVYTVTYTRGDSTVHLQFSAQITESSETVVAPVDKAAYTPITYLDGPKTLERAAGYLLQAQNTSAYFNERIYCQAFGDERTRSVSLYTANADGWAARVDTQTQLLNTGRIGDVTKHLHEELFIDGKYSIRADGGTATENSQIDPETMLDYCQNHLVSTIMLPQDVLNATYSENGNTIRIQYSATEAFAQVLRSNACQTLYQKPELLNELAEESHTDKLVGYLEIDKNSGLPTVSGIEYIGSYVIEGLPYELVYQARQTYELPSAQAANKINEAAGQ